MHRTSRAAGVALITSALASVAISSAGAQDRLKSAAGYDRYEAAAAARRSVALGAALPSWSDSGRTLEYQTRGKRYRFDFTTGKPVELGTIEAEFALGRRGGPARGRQFESAISPDKRLEAEYRDRNVWLSDTAGRHPVAVTTDGSVASRIKNGTASWVYGEELGQMHRDVVVPRKRSPRLLSLRRKPAYRTIFVPLGQTSRIDTTDIEAYPDARNAEPARRHLRLRRRRRRRSVRLDVRNGKPFADSTVGHYVYHVALVPRRQ